jgi:hypothetical protein
MHNANSNIFGTRIFSIAPTTVNIMPQNIIKIFAHFCSWQYYSLQTMNAHDNPSSMMYICYLVLTPWSTVPNNNIWGCQFISPLPPAPWPLTSQRENEIWDVLERYAQYHPFIRQILQILPDKQETQPEVWSCTTKAGHNHSLVSAMCRPHRALLSKR